MGKHVIVVGGGLSGLAASIYLARAGRSVTLFEKRRHLGGRAITHLRRGFRFNLGPHAVFRDGAASRIYRELGVPVIGRSPSPRATALLDGARYTFPSTFLSLLTTSILSAKGKGEAARLFLQLRSIDTRPFADMTAAAWLDANVHDARLRQVLESMMRLSTYSDHPEQQSASVVLEQLRIGRRGVIYVDEGWQKLVDTLHGHAVAAGVNFVSSSRIVGVVHDGGAVRGVELGGLELDDRNDTLSVALPDLGADGIHGTRLAADTVILAVDPITAAEMVGDDSITSEWRDLTPVTMTCLDVGLSRLPLPRPTFALGVDRPHYFSVHSSTAQLAPKGAALIHVAKYRKQRAAVSDRELESEGAPHNDAPVAADEAELDSLLDELQPGWRDLLIHRRFLPSMTVSNALVTPSMRRPAARTAIDGLYLAGDWVGEEGLLSDAALASARVAAQTILAS